MNKTLAHYTAQDLVKLAVGPAAPAPAPSKSVRASQAGQAAPAGSGGIGGVGRALWNNGGKQTINTGLNTLQGIGTTAVGAANTAAGGIGSGLAGVWQGGARLSDAAGLTRDATSVADAFAKPMNQAVIAGMQDVAGGAADTLSGGYFNYDGSTGFGTQPTAPHPGTAVEQMRSGMRDELGRGTMAESAFNSANAVADFSAQMVGTGAAGRGVNNLAKAVQSAPSAAPVLNTLAKTPVVGKPAARVGTWLAGKAPEANMFQKSLTGYYGKAGPADLADEALNAVDVYQNATDPIDRPQVAQIYNEKVRPHIADAYATQNIGNQLRRGDNTDYTMTDAMQADPAMRNRMEYGAVPADAATQIVQQSGETSPENQSAAVAALSANAPALTGPEATQPNPQGGPSPSQKPPSNPNSPLAQYPPGTYSQLPDGSYTMRADIPDEAPPGGHAIVPVDHGIQQEDTSGDQQQAAAPADQAQPTPPATHVGTADKAFSPELMTRVQNAKTPEEQQAVQQEVAGKVKQIVDGDRVLKEGLQDLQAGRADTAAAKAFQARIDTAQNEMIKAEFEKLKQANPNANLSDPGTWSGMLSQATNTVNALPFEHKMLMGLGLGGGLIGILSSLFGGGGMAGGLLGMLGLAVGGGAAAAGGVFGNQAQAATGKLMGDFGNFIGMIPDEARDASNFNEAATAATKKRIADAMRATMFDKETHGQGAQVGQRMLNAERAKFDPLRNLYKTSPQAAYSYLMGMKNGPKTPEEAAQLYDRLNKQYEMTGQEGYLYNSTRDEIRADPLMRFLPENTVMSGLGFTTPEKGASMNIAQVIYLKQAALKAARCWAGYEPVPGKAPYSEDSCRPKRKAKAKKKSVAEKKAASPPAPTPAPRVMPGPSASTGRPAPLPPTPAPVSPTAAAQPSGPYSKTPFDIVHAQKTLGLPSTTPAHLAYNRMMYLHRNKKFTPAQFADFNAMYGNHPPQFNVMENTNDHSGGFQYATLPPKPATPAPAAGQ